MTVYVSTLLVQPLEMWSDDPDKMLDLFASRIGLTRDKARVADRPNLGTDHFYFYTITKEDRAKALMMGAEAILLAEYGYKRTGNAFCANCNELKKIAEVVEANGTHQRFCKDCTTSEKADFMRRWRDGDPVLMKGAEKLKALLNRGGANIK